MEPDEAQTLSDPAFWQASTATFTAVIALLVAMITYRQFRTDRMRLRHELFERRFAVYKSTQKYLTEIMAEGHANTPAYAEFGDAWQRSRFFFKDEIPEFLEIILDTANKNIMLNKRYEPLAPGAERTKLVNEAIEALGRLTDQLPKLHQVFRPHLLLDI